MSRITDFDSLPDFAAASAQGPAIAASFPIHKPSSFSASLVRFASHQIARWKAARNARRTIQALSVLSDRQLQDIGLSRSNIISASTRMAAQNQLIDVK